MGATEQDAGLSFVVVVDEWETARRIVERLAAQTAADRIELVLVAPEGETIAVPPPLAARLARVVVARHSSFPLGAARAVGVRAATADVLVLGETHAFPAGDWAERVLASHAAGWTAVTPSIANANGPGVLGEVALLMDYGRFGPSRPRGRGARLPRTNASLARASVLGSERALEQALGPLASLPIPAAGVRHEPSARIDHLNVDRLLPWAHERYLAGRLVGGSRFAAFSLPRRLAYLLASPLVAGLIFARALRLVVRPVRSPALVGVIGLAALLQAAGEAVGYASGGLEAAERRMLSYELHKWRYARRAGPLA